MYPKKLKTTHVCLSCTSYIIPISHKQGFFLIEIIIWILALALVPSSAGSSILIAIAYSIFRLLSKKMVCTKCKSSDIAFNDTPTAQKIIQERNAVWK